MAAEAGERRCRETRPRGKAMKRLGYAAELTKPAHPKFARVARKAKRIQTQLGEHQDAVVAAAFLTGLGTRASTTDGTNGFTCGILASELARAPPHPPSSHGVIGEPPCSK
jgi:CHAD domain-containing protein